MKKICFLLCIILVGCVSNKVASDTNNVNIEQQSNVNVQNEDENKVKAFEVKRELKSNDSNIVINEIAYTSDGLLIKGFEVKPKISDDKKYPVIIFNRGGNNGFGEIPDKMAMYYLSKFAKEGFVVLASQYRGAHSEGKDEFGGKDINDVYNLMDIAYSLDYIDLDRIYMLGASRGSIMTFLSLRYRDDIKAAAVIGAVPDLITLYNNREDGMKRVLVNAIGGTPEELENEYKNRSAIYWSDMINEPLLMLHGGQDWRASKDQVTLLKEALEKNGTDNKLIIYENDEHGLKKNQLESINEIITWFNKY